MGAVSNVLPAQRGLYVIIGAKLSRLRVYNICVYNIYSATDYKIPKLTFVFIVFLRHYDACY